MSSSLPALSQTECEHNSAQAERPVRRSAIIKEDCCPARRRALRAYLRLKGTYATGSFMRRLRGTRGASQVKSPSVAYRRRPGQPTA